MSYSGLASMMVNHYKAMQAHGSMATASMLSDVKRQYVSMAHGGDGGSQASSPLSRSRQEPSLASSLQFSLQFFLVRLTLLVPQQPMRKLLRRRAVDRTGPLLER